MNLGNRNQIIVLVVLALVLAGAIGRAILRSRTPTPPPTVSTPAMAQAAPDVKIPAVVPVNPERIKTAAVDIDTLLKEIEVVTFDYAAERIQRDPMEPLTYLLRATREPGAGVLPHTSIEVLRKNVTGIIWDEFDPLAVVDDEVVPLGHTYPSGIKVHAIEGGRVVFKVGDSEIAIEMKEL